MVTIKIMFPEINNPPYPVQVGTCAWCGAEVYAGERVYAGDCGLVHHGCMMEMLSQEIGEETLADMCGFNVEIA